MMSISKHVQSIIALDLIFFFVCVSFVNSFKFFFLLLTSCLITLLTYYALNYFIELSSGPTEKNDSTSPDDFKHKLPKLLFQNEHIYKLIKSLARKNVFCHQLQKIISTSTRRKDKLNTLEAPISASQLDLEVNVFMKKFSLHFIESWYKPYVSDNPQFLNEAQLQLEMIFLDLFKRLKQIDKLFFFSNFIFLFNKNYLNIAIAHNSKRLHQIPLESLHMAVRNMPSSDTAYLKRVVQLIRTTRFR